jgi:hypothetical protein
MATLAFFVGTTVAVGLTTLPHCPAQDQGPSQSKERTLPSQSSQSKSSDSCIPAVRLSIVIAGLGREGCDIEVKPGNASCRFRALKVSEDGTTVTKSQDGTQHVSPEGHANLELRDVELRGADRTCTVAITVREPGQDPKTVYRGYRLAARPEKGKGAAAGVTTPTFACYLNSPSKSRLVRAEEARMRK